MVIKRAVVIAGLLGAYALAAAAPAAAQTGAGPPQQRLLAASHGVTVQAQAHTFCRDRTVMYPFPTTSGFCVDGVPGAAAVRLPVHGGGVVTVQTGVPVYAIFPSVHTESHEREVSLDVRALDTSGRLFALTLPDGPPLPRLSVFIHYRNVPGANGARESGDAAFSVGLREHGHERPTSTRVTARVRLRCRRARGHRRRCRLSERGKVHRPAGSTADCSGGRVLVRVLARGRRRLRASLPTSAGCRYRLRNRSFWIPSGSGSIRVRRRYVEGPTIAGRLGAVS